MSKKIALVVGFLIVGIILPDICPVSGNADCVNLHGGFKCTAKYQDDASKLRVVVHNKGQSDVTFDVFKRVGSCMRPQEGMPKNGTIPKDGVYQHDLHVRGGASESISFEHATVAHPCSLLIVRNCRGLNKLQVDCAQLIGVR